MLPIAELSHSTEQRQVQRRKFQGVILPQPIINLLGWETGVTLELHVEGRKLILSPIGPSDQATDNRRNVGRRNLKL
jgi:hypothetical protein